MEHNVGEFYTVKSTGKRAKLIHKDPSSEFGEPATLVLVYDNGRACACYPSEVTEYVEPFTSDAVIWLRSRTLVRHETAGSRMSLTRHFLKGRDWSPTKKTGYTIPVRLSAAEAPEVAQ